MISPRARHFRTLVAQPRGGIKLVLIGIVVVLGVSLVAFLVLSADRPEQVRTPHERESPETQPAAQPRSGAKVFSDWADVWARQVRESSFFKLPEYSNADVLRELTELLKARSKSSSLRDHGEYSLLSASSSADELARTPAIKALIATGTRAQFFALEPFDPTLFLCDLTAEDTFVRAQQKGLPEKLAKFVPNPSKEGDFDVVLMRRRVRERLDDLAEVARAAAKHAQPPANLARYPVLSWVWSLDLDSLEESAREPRPGTLCFFSITDLIAAERVATAWPTTEVARSLEQSGGRTIEQTPFHAFDRAPRWMADGITSLKKNFDRDIQNFSSATNQPAAAFDGLRTAVSALCNHESDRELRVSRPDWHSDSR
jgi:hypothetical protein